MNLNDRRADLIAEGFDFAVRIGDAPGLDDDRAPRRHLSASWSARRRTTWRRTAAREAPAGPQVHRCILNLNMTPAQPLALHRSGRRRDRGRSRGRAADRQWRGAARGGARGRRHRLPADQLVEADLGAGQLVEFLAGWQKMACPSTCSTPSPPCPAPGNGLSGGGWVAGYANNAPALALSPSFPYTPPLLRTARPKGMPWRSLNAMGPQGRP